MQDKDKRKGKQYAVVAGLLAITIIGTFIDVNTGYIKVTFGEFADLILGNASEQLTYAIVDFRLPRVIMALLVGIGLSLSGCVLQGVSRNELAEPGILGINAGAGLMVAIFTSILTGSIVSSAFMIPVSAFSGAVIVTVLLYLLSYKKYEGISPMRLVLNGVGIAAIVNALMIMVLLRMRQEEYGFIAGWLSGNIWGASWTNIFIAAPVIVALGAIVYYKAKELNVLSLQRESAIGLGVAMRKERMILLGAAAGLAGICVAVGGGITFVGLICPHLARKLVGSRHQILIPAAALTGAALLVVSDIIARSISVNGEISVGIVATILGTPYFLYLLVNKKGK